MGRLFLALALIVLMFGLRGLAADATQPKPKVGKLPHVEFDPQKKQVRVECEVLGVDAPLEFFCCVKNTNDYESMVRSEVKPSNLHLALLAIGLQPGHPFQYSEAAKRWIAPQGPPLQITMEYEKEGKTIDDPAWKWLRDVKNKKPCPPFTWIFAGSHVMPDGSYASDVTGYLVSLANVDLTVIDVPGLVSRSLDLLQWERNPDVVPKAGTKVWMVIEPAGADRGKSNDAPATRPAQRANTSDSTPSTNGADGNLADGVEAEVAAAQKHAQQLKDEWQREVAERRDAIKQAAEAHYRIMQDLRAQQQKLIDEADHIQRTIDDLEKQYQDLTTPRPQSK